MDLSHEAKAKDSTRKAKAKTKDFKIVLEDPRERGLVLEDGGWRRGSVVRMSVCSRRTFPDLRLIHG